MDEVVLIFWWYPGEFQDCVDALPSNYSIVQELYPGMGDNFTLHRQIRTAAVSEAWSRVPALTVALVGLICAVARYTVVLWLLLTLPGPKRSSWRHRIAHTCLYLDGVTGGPQQPIILT
ncbi:hypothetical protein QAD02_002242 [Eretmocerus hayati]|uniref:Uncharacterized protein n=1 Tax=Eretmocerus hayati TaxID=131215 RepID=A0ACC2NJJ0_9HYME|nr:hypothetical protein QAD02_002242 [Eretmocerus hayati]